MCGRRVKWLKRLFNTIKGTVPAQDHHRLWRALKRYYRPGMTYDELFNTVRDA